MAQFFTMRNCLPVYCLVVFIIYVSWYDYNVLFRKTYADDDDGIIPQHLIFTHRKSWNATRPEIRANVQAMISMYQTVWPEVTVSFLSDKDCVRILNDVAPYLSPFFFQLSGMFRADLCRVAALYEQGGVYLDTDMTVISPWIPPSGVDFATSWDMEQKHFFQSFLASSAGHFILQKALRNMHRFLKRKSKADVLLGPFTLKQAYDQSSYWLRKNSVLLQESNLSQDPNLFPELERNKDAIGYCNNVVHDGSKAYFWSRTVGLSPRCAEKVPIKTIAKKIRSHPSVIHANKVDVSQVKTRGGGRRRARRGQK